MPSAQKGPPLYLSKNIEDPFEYCILAENQAGTQVYLNVYSGSSGPSIGGNQDAYSKAAADILAEYITGAPAADYEYEGFYMDESCIVRQGVKDGVPYQEETELEPESPETWELLQKVSAKTKEPSLTLHDSYYIMNNNQNLS